jgi:hypothetical protein
MARSKRETRRLEGSRNPISHPEISVNVFMRPKGSGSFSDQYSKAFWSLPPDAAPQSVF